MLSRCVSWLLLRLVSVLARWARRPLDHYVSFDRDVQFLTIGLTGRREMSVFTGLAVRAMLCDLLRFLYKISTAEAITKGMGKKSISSKFSLLEKRFFVCRTWRFSKLRSQLVFIQH